MFVESCFQAKKVVPTGLVLLKTEVCFNWAPLLGASFWVTWLVLQVTLLPVTTFVKQGKSYSITDTEDSHSTGALISSASQHKDLHVSACVRDLLHVCNYSIPSQHAMHPKCVSLFPILHSQQQRMELQHWFDSEGILVSEREPVTEPHLQTRPEISPECRFEYLDHVCKHERCLESCEDLDVRWIIRCSQQSRILRCFVKDLQDQWKPTEGKVILSPTLNHQFHHPGWDHRHTFS